MNPEWKHLNVKALECIIRRLWWYKWDTGDLWQLLMIFCLVMPSVAMGSKYHQPLNNLKETKKEYPYHMQQVAKETQNFPSYLVGSSRKSNVGSVTNSIPMLTRFLCPPEMPLNS